MPCYDKKLEASRQDFYNEQYRTRDVDCVITTGELELLMQENGWDLHVPVEDEDRMETYLPKADDSSSVSSVPTSLSSGGTHVADLELEIPELVQQPGSSSGSWLQMIIARVQEREATRGRQTAVRSRTIRTDDYEEFSVESFVALPTHEPEPEPEPESEIVFRGARCYGFRNLQNVVRKVGRETGVHVGAGAAGRLLPSSGGTGAGRAALRARRAKQQAAAGDDGENEPGAGRTVKGEDRPYDYVEVMACPAGCVNGGGQARRMKSLFPFLLAALTDLQGKSNRAIARAMCVTGKRAVLSMGTPPVWAHVGAIVNGSRLSSGRTGVQAVQTETTRMEDRMRSLRGLTQLSKRFSRRSVEMRMAPYHPTRSAVHGG